MPPIQSDNDSSSFWRPYFRRLAKDPAAARLRPHLERVLKDMDLLLALEHGKVDAVATVLERRRKDAEQGERDAIDFILSHRRLLVYGELYSKPRMFRLLGTGSSFLGKAEFDPSDRSYITHRRFTLFWVPLVTQGAYLVHEDNPGEFRIRARVPLEAHVLGRRKAALSVLVVFALLAFGGGFFATNPDLFHIQRHPSAVHIVNGLEFPVTVEAGDASLEVPALGRVEHPLKKGPLHLVTQGPDGKILEEENVDNKSGKDIFVYNILGAAPVYVREVAYDADGQAKIDVKPLFGGRVSRLEDIYGLFVPPPDTVRLPLLKDSVTRRYLSLETGGWAATVGELADAKTALAVVKRLLIADAANEAVYRAAVEVLSGMEPADAVEEARYLYADHWESVNAQRLLMAMMDRKAGRNHASEAYQRLQLIDPAMPIGALLLSQAVQPDKALLLLEPAVKKFPTDRFLRSSLAHRLFLEQKFEQANHHFELLEKEDPRALRSNYREHALTLLALGRPSDAVSLAARIGDTNGFPIDWEFAVFYGQLSSHIAETARPHPSDHYVAQTRRGLERPAFAKTFFAAMMSDTLPPQEIMDTLASEDERNLVVLVTMLNKNLDIAMDVLELLSAEALAELDDIRLLLMAGELKGRGNSDGTSRCLRALDLYAPWERPVMDALLEGKKSPLLGEVDLEIRAALKLVEARAEKPGSELGQAAREEAVKLDLIDGIVARAASVWRDQQGLETVEDTPKNE